MGGLALYLVASVILRHVVTISDTLSAEIEGSVPWVAVWFL